MIDGRKCEVCKEAQFKYKCPTCLITYCSIPCFKKHKEVPCEKPVPVPSKVIALPALPPKRLLQIEDPSQLLQRKQLESLALSNEVCEALKDDELQKLIYKIDASVAAESELDKAMEIEGFRKFTDKILSIIGTQD